ncbi:MAG: NAD-binding protein [Campylobacterales bacterium]|nr:NAD-binding protein [Campylobacterales bacterium]
MESTVLIFGYSEYAVQIAKQVRSLHHVRIFVHTDGEAQRALEDGFEVERFDFSDRWHDDAQHYDAFQNVLYCALEGREENLFLTLSLRDAFVRSTIVALAGNHEDVHKLKMAGADKVFPIVQMTADLIVDLIEKPIVTDVLHKILYEKSDLQIAQITITKGSWLCGKRTHDLLWEGDLEVIIIAIVDLELHSTFVFTAKGLNHHIDEGDILVVIGYHGQIEAFRASIGGA